MKIRYVVRSKDAQIINVWEQVTGKNNTILKLSMDFISLALEAGHIVTLEKVKDSSDNRIGE